MGDNSAQNFVCFSSGGQRAPLALEYARMITYDGHEFHSALHLAYYAYCLEHNPSAALVVRDAPPVGGWKDLAGIDLARTPERNERGNEAAHNFAQAIQTAVEAKFSDPVMRAELMRTGNAILVFVDRNTFLGVDREPGRVEYDYSNPQGPFQFDDDVKGENVLGEMQMGLRDYILRRHEFTSERAFCFKRIHPDAKPPVRKSEFAAGYDLTCVEEVLVPARGFAQARVGFKASVPKNFFVRISSRSGLFFDHGIEAFHGTIDADYRGEWIVGLKSHSDEPTLIEKGTRVAQALVLPYATPEVNELDDWAELADTERGEGGFGSTGK